MTISALSKCNTYQSPNRSSRGGSKIGKFTPHHMAGVMTAESCGKTFMSPSRQASSNYGIGCDGKIACYVEEESRAWTSSSQSNDSQAITVEVSNSSTGGDWPVSNEAYNSLINLAVDVCSRYKFKLTWTGDSSGTLTNHWMFASTACPGPYLKSRMKQLADEVNKRVAEGGVLIPNNTTSFMDTPTAYQAAVNAGVLPPQEEMYPYIISIDQNSGKQNYSKLKEMGVQGTCIDIGSYYNSSYIPNKTFRQPKLDEQIKEAEEAKMPFGLYTTIRSKTLSQAENELSEIRLAVRKYPPELGLWLKLSLPGTKSQNNTILKFYEEEFMKLGFKGQIGLYDTKEKIKTIDWSKFYDNWYLWLVEPVKNLDDVPVPVTPEFFMYDENSKKKK